MRNHWTFWALLLAASTAVAEGPTTPPKPKTTQGQPLWNELPLPLPVRTPADLAFKQETERVYLVFNLLAAGKLAFDAGKYAEAADQWETLLTLPGLDRAIDKVVRPLAIDARQRAGQAPTIAAETPPAPVETPAPQRVKAAPNLVDVTGQVSGGGAGGPGGTVVQLRRADGKPAPTPAPGRFLMTQKNKVFLPHVLAVPVGSTVEFRNDDAIYHNVFSLSAPAEFDLGLYKGGLAKGQAFDKPGPVQVFCNIHAAMNAWVVAVSSPWFAVADASGRFTIRQIPPGQYVAEAWHEASSQPSSSPVTVAPGGGSLALTVGGDRRSPVNPPDKYGKARQTALGY